MVSDCMAPRVKRIRAYFAPVQRVGDITTLFDPAKDGAFNLDDAPEPWVDLGWITGFERTSGTAIGALKTGSPGSTAIQVRSEIDATVSFAFQSWGKLQLSLAAGTQQMNLLSVQSGVASTGSGGQAVPAVALAAGSSATELNVGVSAAMGFSAGSLVSVDVDYATGATGFVGSGVSGAYVKTALTDVDYVRRVSLNVGRVSSVSNGVLQLQTPLLAGTPVAGMKVSPVVGFCDREGSTFFQEWSALFVAEGQQGERVLWHYPRLQTASGITEEIGKGAGGYGSWQLKGRFRALPVSDAIDGERVLCFRSYVTR